jgi:hypothetical protein
VGIEEGLSPSLQSVFFFSSKIAVLPPTLPPLTDHSHHVAITSQLKNQGKHSTLLLIL